MSEENLSRLETQIGRLLRVGVVVSATLLSIGLVLTLAGAPVADRLLQMGLVVLMAIPFTRILASFADALRRRDRLLAGSTAVVLLVMALSLVYSLAGRL